MSKKALHRKGSVQASTSSFNGEVVAKLAGGLAHQSSFINNSLLGKLDGKQGNSLNYSSSKPPSSGQP